jgi:hypothetical protein
MMDAVGFTEGISAVRDVQHLDYAVRSRNAVNGILGTYLAFSSRIGSFDRLLSLLK